MEESNGAAPRRGATDEADFSGLFRDVRPRRLLTDDDATEVRPRTRDTLWRADDAGREGGESSSDASLLDGLLREDEPEEGSAAETHTNSSATEDSEQQRSKPGFGRTILCTFLSTFLPGLGLVGSRQKTTRWIGALVTLGFVGLAVAGAALFASRVKPDEGESFISAAASAAVGVASGRGMLHIATVLLVAVGLLWVALIVATHIATRPRNITQGKRLVGSVLVGILSLAVAAPVAVGAAYSQVLAATLHKTFPTGGEVVSNSKPNIDDGPNPFGDLKRLNILLIGSDLDAGRIASGVKDRSGFRTDTVMLASVDTTTGRTALIQIPRNLQHTPFPEGSEMAEEFPDGFRGEGEEAEWYFNAIWERVDRDYPHLLEGQTYPGAEALKQGVEGITGLPVHYFLLLNIDGLRNLIDAMGGVTVNINERLPMGGSSSNPGATWGYLEVGADQHLDGIEGVWFARSRWMSDDYSRMRRQSCLIKAITDQANPGTLLTRFEAIAGASSDMVMTDIPQEILEPLTDLALKTQKQPMERLAFVPGQNGYSYADPDFETMRQHVQDLINPPTTAPSPSASPAASPSSEPSPSAEPSDDDAKEPKDGAQNVADACAFNPKQK